MSDEAAPAVKKRRRRRANPTQVVLDTMRKQATRLDRLGSLVADALETSMEHAVERVADGDVALVTSLTDAAGKFIKEAGAGIGAMANALDKVSKASPTDTGDDKPLSPDDLKNLFAGGKKRS